MENNSNTLLIIEDDTGLSELIAEKMGENGYETVCMLSAHEALDWLNEHTPLLIILDFSLPGMNGKEFIVELKSKNQYIPPFIVSTGQGDERVAVEMMKLGSRDYVIKDRNLLELIPIVVHRVHREIANENKLKEAEKSLRQRESYLSAIIDNHPGMISLKDSDGKYLMANKEFASFWGFQDVEQIIGKTATDILPKGVVEKNVADDFMAFRQKETIVSEMSIYNNGKTKWFVNYNSPIFNGGGKVAGTVGISINISERKLAEELLKENEARLRRLNSDKDRFMSIMAHDLKSPFNCIVGLSEILISQVQDKNLEGIEKYAEIIQQSSLQVMDLLTNLMEWSRSQTGRMKLNPENSDLINLINEITLLFEESARQKSITIKKELPSNIFVNIDKAMISTILRNLISNAIKFSFPQGEIIISTEEKQNEITVKISDNGVGIPRDSINKLFHIDEKLTTPGTQNEQGTGLGLILCKEFVEKHNGEIWVTSKEGKGSTFSFTLPLQG